MVVEIARLREQLLDARVPRETDPNLEEAPAHDPAIMRLVEAPAALLGLVDRADGDDPEPFTDALRSALAPFRGGKK